MADTRHTLFLFDIDEVLVHPIGYDEGMRAAIHHFARQMGLDIAGPSDEDIAAFHAYGMTNEWLSGAMCLAALVVEATAARPDLIGPSLFSTMSALREGKVSCPSPDFGALAKAIYRRNSGGVHTPGPVFTALCERTPPELHPILAEILHTIRPPEAPFAVIFQQLALGPRQFSEIYGLESTIGGEAYLALDQPMINPKVKQRLRRALRTDHCGAAIYSARPSLPPKGLSLHELDAVDRLNYPPEAEMATDVAGMRDLPLIAAGRMVWLAGRYGKAIDTYVKPSPVEALAAMAAAATGDERGALEAAGRFAEEGRLSGPLAQIAGERTHVVVFEDSSGGIRGVRQAADLLRAEGAEMTVSGVGIAQDPVKRRILAETADQVAPDVNAGLSPMLDALLATSSRE